MGREFMALVLESCYQRYPEVKGLVAISELKYMPVDKNRTSTSCTKPLLFKGIDKFNFLGIVWQICTCVGGVGL